MSLDIQEIRIKMEMLRNELSKEYEKSLDKGGINTKVISLSQQLDKLILEYLEMNTPKNKIFVTNVNNEIA